MTIDSIDLTDASHISAGPETESAGDIADAVRSATHCDLSIVLLISADQSSLELAGWSSDEWFPDDEEAIEHIDADTPGSRSIQRKTTLVFGQGGNPVDGLPQWTHESGFQAAIVVPMFRGETALGAIYALFTRAHISSLGEINQAELAVSMGVKSLPPRRLSSEAGGSTDVFGIQGVEPGSVRDLQSLSLGEAVIDPVREQVSINGVNVALSRTEFMILYTLGQSPGTVVPHHVLLETCWQDDIPSLTAVDATVYRLRKKLAHAQNGRYLVRTVRGEGYALNPTLSKRRGTKARKDSRLNP